MAPSRRTGGLNPVQVTPARFTPETAYSGPADQSATRSLIEGLGMLGANVARLGQSITASQQRTKEDPQARRLAQARVQLESMRAENDPGFAAGQYNASAEGSIDREAWAEQAGRNYLEKSRDAILKLSLDRGVNNVNWESEFARLADEGVKGGYLPDDHAASAFVTGANGLLNELKVGGIKQDGINAEYSAGVSLQTQTQTKFVDTLAQAGAPEAQKVLDGLTANPEFQKLQPQQKDQILLETIQGIVGTGGMRALNALSQVDGPDGRPLKDRYAAQWPIWEKNALANARTLANGEVRDAESAVGGGDFQQQVEKFRGLGNDVVAQTIMAPQMVAATVEDYKRRITELDAKGELNPDGSTLRELKEEARAFAEKEGYLGSAEGLQAFNAQWGNIEEAFEKQRLTKVAQDENLKQNALVSNGLKATLETALKSGGPEAATVAVEKALVLNSAFKNKSFAEQTAFLRDAAQGFAAEGNRKAFDALSKVKVNNDGTTFDKAIPALDWQKLQADLSASEAAKEKARQGALVDELDTYALTGEIPATVLTKMTDAGVSAKQILEAQRRAGEIAREKRNETDKVNAAAFKDRFFTEQSTLDAGLLENGRIDLLEDVTVPNPFNEDKPVTITAKDRVENGMKRLERRIEAEVNAQFPNASPEEKLVKRQVKRMQLFARNGEVDPTTQKTVGAMARKVQVDGYSVTDDDRAQLRDLTNAVEVYGIHRVKDYAGSDRERDFIESVMLNLKSGDSEDEAIRSARSFREATPDQLRMNVSKKEVTDTTTNILDTLGAREDPNLPQQVERMVEKKMQLGASQGAAEDAVTKELQATRAQVGGRWLNINGLKGATSPQQVSEVLTEAIDHYKKQFPETADLDMTFKLDPKNGTLIMIDSLLGAPVSATSRPVRWQEILSSFNKRIDEPRRKAAQEEGTRAAAEAFSQQESVRKMQEGEPEAMEADRRLRQQQLNPDN